MIMNASSAVTFLPARRQNLSTTNNKTAMRFLSRRPGCGVWCFVTLLHINTCYILWNDRKLFFLLRRFSQWSLITFHKAKIIHHWAFCAVPGQKPKRRGRCHCSHPSRFPSCTVTDAIHHIFPWCTWKVRVFKDAMPNACPSCPVYMQHFTSL